MMQEIERVLAFVKSYANSKSIDFVEYVDICIYPDMIEEWISKGMGTTAIKKQVETQYFAYNEQRKYLSSLA